MRTVYLLIVACLQLEDRCLWLADRLVDNGLLSVIFQQAHNELCYNEIEAGR